MQVQSDHLRECARLAALRALDILDSPPDEEFDAIVRVAAQVCGTPIGLISLIDDKRQWFKANLGLAGILETPRALAFCDYTIQGDDILEVVDAMADERFTNNALVTGPPGIRFYAGMPLRLSDGSHVGSLCVIDQNPKRLDVTQRDILRDLGRAAACALEKWADSRRRLELERTLAADHQRLASMVDAFGSATWEWHVPTDGLRLSDSWLNLIATRPADYRSLREIVHRDDLGRVDAAMAAHLSGVSDRYTLEYRMRHSDGHFIWVQSQGTLVGRTADGHPEWVFGFIKNITDRKSQEEKLRRSERFLEQTSRVAGVGGWEIDLSTGELHLTTESLRIAGLPFDQPPTVEEALCFYAPEVREKIQDARRKAIETGAPYQFEVPYLPADGRRIWVRVVGSAVFEDGRAVRLVGAIQDISVQVEQKIALQQAHERMAMAANSGGIGVFDWDIVADTLYWDDWMCRLYGTVRPDIHDTFRVWSRLVHPDDRAAAECAVRDAIPGIRPYDAEFRVVWADGSIHWLHAVGTIIRDAAGAALRMVGTNRDITPQRQMADELLRGHEMLRVTLQSIGDAVITTDAEGHIVWLNPLAEQLTGWVAAAAAGKPKVEVVRLIDEATRQERPDLVPECLKTGATLAQAPNVVMVSRYGQECPIENTLSPIRDANGQVLGVVIVFRDVSSRRLSETERQEREHKLSLANAELEKLARHFAKARNVAEQASRAKTRFLAGMSHELRTPLNGILGYAQLLRMDGGLTVVQSERVEAMLSAGTHLLEMVSCVLDLSEIENEGVELQIAPLDLPGLAEASLNIVRPTAELKSLSLALLIGATVPPRIVTDPSRLRQVLLNLLGNAVKYTRTGAVELRIVLVTPKTLASSTMLRFEVVDTGPGISAERRHRLFGEYDRLDAHEETTIEGAGLGLSLAKRLATLLSGELGYVDNPVGGSVFWFEIPLVADIAAAPPAARASDFTLVDSPLALPGAIGSRILVVDDVAMNRDIAAAFLRSAGYEIVCVEGGAEAVDAATNGDFLVILMDVRMPKIDGLEASRRIRALPGQRGSVPIIALTAQVFAEQINACQKAGMNTHLAKPFTLETLLGAIARGVAAAQDRRPNLPPGRRQTTSEQQTAVACMLGADLPVFDEKVFDLTAAALKPEAVRIYLAGLGDRAEALNQQLNVWDGGQEAAAELAEEAHALAGSAGMLGFQRLAFVAKHFERAIDTDDDFEAASACGLGEALAAAIKSMLDEIDRTTGVPSFKQQKHVDPTG
jgi:PAS domain S-box-containing protein